MSGQQLAEELHRTIIKKDKKRKLQSPFKDNIWGADLAGMQWINKIWVEEGNEFYNGLMRWWLEKNDIEIYSTHNENLFLVKDLLEY